MANVTYLMGAGASANALPIYKNFKDRFKLFELLFSKNLAHYHEMGVGYDEQAKKLKQQLKLFINEFNFHNTPDTIAKKLFHTTRNEMGLDLNDVKKILTLFFIYEQTVDPNNSNDIYNNTPLSVKMSSNDKEFIDKRYDSLIAALLKPVQDQVILLSQFKILTWNYDLQFELAFRNYVRIDPSLRSIQLQIQGFPKINKEDNHELDLNQFSLVHLNGIAYSKTKKDSHFGMKTYFSAPLAEHILDVYKEMNMNGPDNNSKPLLDFAWENIDEEFNILTNESLNHATKIAMNTEYLVVIGYSFPIFNYAIDRVLLKKMTRLRKVFVQSNDSEQIIKILRSHFSSNNTIIEYEDVGYTSPFYIPNEWNT